MKRLRGFKEQPPLRRLRRHLSQRARLVLIKLIPEPEIIRNHCDELAIGRFSSIILNGISKIGIEGIFAFTFREKYAIL